MKYKILLTSLIFFLSLSFTVPVFAVMNANFTKASSLQPPPPDIYPNFSGSINSSSTYDTSYNYLSDFSDETIDDIESALPKNDEIKNTNVNKNQSTIWYWVFSIIIISLILFKLYPSPNRSA